MVLLELNLNVSIPGQFINLLAEYLGQVRENRSAKDMLDNPIHRYTNVFISAAPLSYLETEQEELVLAGKEHSPLNPPEVAG